MMDKWIEQCAGILVVEMAQILEVHGVKRRWVLDTFN